MEIIQAAKKLNSISQERLNFRRRTILCTNFYRDPLQASNLGGIFDQLFLWNFFMQFSHKMPLHFFYTMVQESEKWPKTQIKGSCLLNQQKNNRTTRKKKMIQCKMNHQQRKTRPREVFNMHTEKVLLLLLLLLLVLLFLSSVSKPIILLSTRKCFSRHFSNSAAILLSLAPVRPDCSLFLASFPSFTLFPPLTVSARTITALILLNQPNGLTD